MKNKFVFATTYVLLSVLIFFGVVYSYTNIFYFRFASYIGVNGIEILGNPFVSWSIMFLVFLLIIVNLFFFLQRRILKKLLIVDYALYFSILFFALFLKSPNSGVYGLALNPFGFLFDLLESPFEVIVNVLLFIPLGILFSLLSISFKRTFLSSLLLIVIAEVTQFVFKLGFFDLSDVILNLLGVILGYQLLDFLYKKE